MEMYFRHKVDDQKRNKVCELGLPAIEIDLSDLDVSTGFESIEERVLHDMTSKSWLFFPT